MKNKSMMMLAAGLAMAGAAEQSNMAVPSWDMAADTKRPASGGYNRGAHLPRGTKAHKSRSKKKAAHKSRMRNK